MAATQDSQAIGHQDFRPLHWLAMYTCSRAVGAVAASDLDRPTPCDGWSVKDLLRHMVGHNRGFATELEGHTPNAAVWDGLDLGLDPRPHWDESARRVVAAFSALTSLNGEVSVANFGVVRADQAARMHAIDYLVHAWDLGVAIGQPPDLDEGACETVLLVARTWPSGHPGIWGPGAPFASPVPVPDDAPVTDQMLGILGRDPAWPHPAA